MIEGGEMAGMMREEHKDNSSRPVMGTLVGSQEPCMLTPVSG